MFSNAITKKEEDEYRRFAKEHKEPDDLRNWRSQHPIVQDEYKKLGLIDDYGRVKLGKQYSHLLPKTSNIAKILRDESLNPSQFKAYTQLILNEIEREGDINTVVTALNLLEDFRYLQCRREHGMSSNYEVQACVRESLKRNPHIHSALR